MGEKVAAATNVGLTGPAFFESEGCWRRIHML